MSLRGGGGAEASPGAPTHDDHRHHGATSEAFERLDALMSRQPPNAKIPQPQPVNAQEYRPDPSTMWDEMWGLWLPRNAR